jgi:octaprenyl-diphosphate synthase
MANIGNLDLTEADYLQVITDKTAVLMEAACRGGAILGGFEPNKEEALAQFGLNLGIAFQMTDDVIDYRSDVQTMGKPQCKDIQEGKLTLPLIAALRNATASERKRVEKMISEKTLSGEDQVWIRDWVERTGGIQQTLESGRAFLEKGTARLEIFPDSEEKRALMKLAERILHRTF